LARGIRTLIQWLSHDVLALAEPNLATRWELFDFITDELERLEPEDVRRIRPVRVALRNQRDDLLAFAGALDKKLAGIAWTLEISQSLACEACMLYRLPNTATAYWEGWNPAPGEDRRQVPRRPQSGEPDHGADPAQQFAGGEPQLAAA
jgi:hypothetical protein